MRLEQITLPYLQSKLTIKDFSDTVSLSTARVSQLIKRDLTMVYCKLFKESDFYIRRVPRTIQDRQKWEKRVNEYIEIINLPDRIKRDNRKIADLTVDEFVSLMSSIKSK